jgi:protein-tyrosine-phosphatase
MLADSERARPVLAAGMRHAQIGNDAIAAVREAGCAPSDVVMREASASLFASADLVVTMGSSYRRELLATTPPHRREHWLIPEVLGADTLERTRLARDLIRSRVAMLVFMEGWGRTDLSREAARATRPRRTEEMQAAL